MQATQANAIALVVGLTGMSTVVVLMRIFARTKTKISLGLDDYWILAAVVLNMAYLGVNIWGSTRT